MTLLQKAGAAHIKLATEAADGRGVDRHLFGTFPSSLVADFETDEKWISGLKMLLKEGEQLPAIYADPTFSKSSNWILSTSQLTVRPPSPSSMPLLTKLPSCSLPCSLGGDTDLSSTAATDSPTRSTTGR